jgi:hypothetical protein
MNNPNFLIIVILLLVSFNSIGQNFYSEKIEGCNTERFGLEGDSTTAKKSKIYLAELISDSIDENTLNKTRGILKIQVIAYKDKSSCMISYENATNKSDKEINILAIKKTIDKELIWDSVEETVSPLIEFYFLYETISVKRMGFDGNNGLHELND